MKRHRYDYVQGNSADIADNPITIVTGANAEAWYDEEGIERTIQRASEPGKASLYPIGRDPAAFHVEVGDVLVTVATRHAANSTHALVRSNLAGLDSEAAGEYADHPDQERAVLAALEKKTRVAGIALTRVDKSANGEDLVTRLVAGSVTLRQPPRAGRRKIGPGDLVVFRPPKSTWGPVSAGQDPYVNGVSANKRQMEPEPFEPLFVAEDLLTNIHLTLDDPERYRRVLGARSKIADVVETSVRHTCSSALATVIFGLRELANAGLITFTDKMSNSAPLGSIEQRALADLVSEDAPSATQRAAAADAAAALLGEFLGVTNARQYDQDRETRALFGRLRRDMLGSIFHNPADVTHEFGYVPGSASPAQMPKFKARYEGSSRLRRGDAYGDLAHVQNNHFVGLCSAIVGSEREMTKNAVATALTGSGSSNGNFFAMLKL